MKEPEPRPTKLKVCSLCGQPKPLSEFHRRRQTVKSGFRAACKACTSEARKKIPRKPKDEEERHKARVRAQTQYAVEQKTLVTTPCARCGDPDSEAHHLSYDRPDSYLDVEWLCRLHHATEHGRSDWMRQRELFPALDRGPRG